MHATAAIQGSGVLSRGVPSPRQIPGYVVPPEHCDVSERNFRVFAIERNFRATWQIMGCFGANNLPYWGYLGTNWTSEHP